MSWIKGKKLKVLVGGIVTAIAATYGVQMNGQDEEEKMQTYCKCVWYNDVEIVEKGVNKK